MVRDILLADLLANYAELLERGFYSPDWASGHYELNADEEAWIEELEAQAAIDEIRITHTWKSEAGGWTLAATIAPPRHDREYRLPKARLRSALATALRTRLGHAAGGRPPACRGRARRFTLEVGFDHLRTDHSPRPRARRTGAGRGGGSSQMAATMPVRLCDRPMQAETRLISGVCGLSSLFCEMGPPGLEPGTYRL